MLCCWDYACFRVSVLSGTGPFFFGGVYMAVNINPRRAEPSAVDAGNSKEKARHLFKKKKGSFSRNVGVISSVNGQTRTEGASLTGPSGRESRDTRTRDGRVHI